MMGIGELATYVAIAVLVVALLAAIVVFTLIAIGLVFDAIYLWWLRR